MIQPLLPGIEEADFENKLWFLHDPYIYLDDPLNFQLFLGNDTEDTYLYLLICEREKSKYRKNPVDNNK